MREIAVRSVRREPSLEVLACASSGAAGGPRRLWAAGALAKLFDSVTLAAGVRRFLGAG
jgi:hypothetical protein